MGSIGTPELIVLGVLALLIFGPKRLPEIGRNVGAAIREFRKASRDIMAHFDDEPSPPRVRTVSRYDYDGYTQPEEPSAPASGILPAVPHGAVPHHPDGDPSETASPEPVAESSPAVPERKA